MKTRIALERLRVGESLEVLLTEGEPLESVPRSAAEDGHVVLASEPAPGEGQGIWRVLLRKGEPREDGA